MQWAFWDSLQFPKVGICICLFSFWWIAWHLIANKQHEGSEGFQKICCQLFHSSLSHILHSLKPWMTKPQITQCGDGYLRWVIYGLGCIANYPEQVLLHVLYLGGVQSESPYLHYQDCYYMSLGVQLNQPILIMTPQQYYSHIITQVHWRRFSRVNEEFFGMGMASLIMSQYVIICSFLHSCWLHLTSLSQQTFPEPTSMSFYDRISSTRSSRVCSKTILFEWVTKYLESPQQDAHKGDTCWYWSAVCIFTIELQYNLI